MTDLFHVPEDGEGRLGRDEVSGLGAAMAGGKAKLSKVARRAFDYYPTPADCTRALLAAEGRALLRHVDAQARFPGRASRIWEPCGHGGAIARELHRAGFLTVASDVRPDPANGVAALDLLEAAEALSPIVVTNTPFALAHRMIVHLLARLRVRYLACLLKTTFFSTSSEERGRVGLWRAHPPSRRWDMGFRPDFTHAAGGEKGSPAMLCSWFVWDVLAEPPEDGLVPTGLLLRDGPVGFGRGDNQLDLNRGGENYRA